MSEELDGGMVQEPEVDAAIAPGGVDPWSWNDSMPGSGEAPEWLNQGKYSNVEEQAKAYRELETRFGGFTGAPETYSANQTTNVTGILDIDASASMTIDSPNGSIDLPAGNITSNDVTLHTHTHTEVPGTGGASSPSPATQETTAPTSGT